MPTLAEKREELSAKQDQLGDLFKKYPDVASITPEDAAEIKRRNDELTDLGKEVDRLADLERIAQTTRRAQADLGAPKNGMVHQGVGARTDEGKATPIRSLREILTTSVEYQAYVAGRAKTASFVLSPAEYKTLVTLGDINNVPTRRPGIVESAQEMRTVSDLLLQGTIDNNTMTYIEETTFTNAAATVAEGGTKPESVLDFTERTDNVRKIATWIPATRELLQDVAGFESYLRGRLTFMVARTEEVQILSGDGVAPNILGILNRSGIQTQAKGADPTPDAVYKAMTLVRNTGFAEPTGAVFHPNDWQDIKLLRTADGIYIWGSPSEDSPDRIWGLDVRVTTAMTQNTGLVGAFRPYAQLFQREDVVVTVSTEHSTFFVENKVAILAEERMLLAVYRPAAFCKVTGI